MSWVLPKFGGFRVRIHVCWAFWQWYLRIQFVASRTRHLGSISWATTWQEPFCYSPVRIMILFYTAHHKEILLSLREHYHACMWKKYKGEYSNVAKCISRGPLPESSKSLISMLSLLPTCSQWSFSIVNQIASLLGSQASFKTYMICPSHLSDFASSLLCSLCSSHMMSLYFFEYAKSVPALKL